MREFMAATGCYLPDCPSVPPRHVVRLWRRLIREEWRELRWAVRSGNLERIAKEAADLRTVVDGMMLAHGIEPQAAQDVVHASNMTKAGGPIRRDGKVLKGPGYRPPDMAAVVGRVE
jgi:predicted HAD superfamily Cof-like phosphohydrolase